MVQNFKELILVALKIFFPSGFLGIKIFANFEYPELFSLSELKLLVEKETFPHTDVDYLSRVILGIIYNIFARWL